MKKLGLIVLIISQLLFSQKLFEKEPEVRVRIINTLDELNITFDNKWLMEYQGGVDNFTPNSGEVVFTINNGNIIVTSKRARIRYRKRGD